MSRTSDLLERALAAEERADALQAEVDDVRARLKSSLNADPTTAVSALAWVRRTEEAERLVKLVLKHVGQHYLKATDLPPGWVAQAESQLRAVAIAMRDQEGFQRPADTDYWAMFTDGDRLGIVRDEHDDRPGRP